MNILGRVLSHENSACLLIGNEFHTAIQTERITRNKYENSRNDLAIQYCLSNARLLFKDVDYIVQNCPKHYFPMKKYGKIIDSHKSNVYTISHHLAHAYACYGLSPFNDALIMIVDGRGNFVKNKKDMVFRGDEFIKSLSNSEIKDFSNWQIEVESYYKADENQIELIEKNVNRGAPPTIGVEISKTNGKFPDEFSGFYQYMGLGALYEQVTEYVFNSNLDAGKVMGFAPYGNHNDLNYNMLDLTDDGYYLTIDWLNLYDNKPNDSRKIYFKEYKNLCAKVQHELERALIHKANNLYARYKCKNLCIGGGVGLNSVANKKILDNTPFDNIYIQPACNDAGISMGASMWGLYNLTPKNCRKVFFNQTDYYGKMYNDDFIEKELINFKKKGYISYTFYDEIELITAKLLSDSHIVAWFQGQSEFGPRALGNRSILADPRDKNMKDFLNKKVKFREDFRPFAPSVLEEYYEEYFDLNCPSPFMLLVAKVLNDKIPAVTHIDGTARVQTVNKDQNKKYYTLINEFYKLTNIPVLLNTSFNIKGDPIVEAPKDAITCFLDTGIDYLIISNYLVKKKIAKKVKLSESDSIELKERIKIKNASLSNVIDSNINFELIFQDKKLIITSEELNVVNRLLNKIEVKRIMDEYGEKSLKIINKLNENGMLRVF